MTKQPHWQFLHIIALMLFADRAEVICRLTSHMPSGTCYILREFGDMQSTVTAFPQGPKSRNNSDKVSC